VPLNLYTKNVLICCLLRAMPHCMGRCYMDVGTSGMVISEEKRTELGENLPQCQFAYHECHSDQRLHANLRGT
jgi:hypothetical protein